MALILNIDTALDSGSVSISDNDQLLAWRNNTVQKDHASWIHTAIKEMTGDAGLEINKLQAVAVSSGPGSYTGLRIGMSVAKGLCYSLNLPLITIGTLEIMTAAAIHQSEKKVILETDWLCPMIDARRMEVYFGIYNCHGLVIQEPAAAVVDEHLFFSLLEKNRILYFGNGAAKLQSIITHPHAVFLNVDLQSNAKEMASLSYDYWQGGKFSPLSLVEPFYIKDFYSPQRKDS